MDRLSQLSEDVLWAIMGFVDLPTLYSARLVCKSFAKAAAGRFKALDCTTVEELPTTDFTQFSGTTYLGVTVSHKSPVQSLAHPRIAPVITHVSLEGFHLRNRQSAEEVEAVLMCLPKLRSVSVQPLVGHSGLPLFPAGLEELQITDRHYGDSYWREHWGGLRNGSPLTRYSRLTRLAIDVAVGPGTLMESLSSLRNLRSLDLRSCSSALGPLRTLPALTSLTFEERYSGIDGSMFQELGRLTGLLRLALLMIWTPRHVKHEELWCIAQLTNLTCLDMSGWILDNSLASSIAVAALTRLVAVQFNRDAVRVPQLSLRQLEAVHSLGLGNVVDVSILGWASRLTHLGLSCRIQEGETTSLQGLRPALAEMSRLRSLDLSVIVSQPRDYVGPDGSPVICLDGILRACTKLTKLAYRGELQPYKNLTACASLPGLRSLSFVESSALTRAWLPVLQAMSGLTELSLRDTGIPAASMTTDVIAAFDVERRQLGWPLLKLRIISRDGECSEQFER